MTSATQILTLHDLIHLEMGGSGARRRRLYYEYAVKPAIKRAGSVLTVSETSAGHIRTWLQDSSVEVINVGNGCSDVFAHSRSSKQGDYLLYVGNLKAHKNFDVLLRAIRLRPDYRLVAVVSDRINAEMLIEANGLQGQVKVVSDLEDTQLAGLYQGAIGLVLPSVLEGFGLPAVESLACGRPVAFFRGCQSVAEIVGLHGVAVENHGSGEEWAEAMDQLYGLQGSFEAPGRLWRDQYTWANVSSRVESHLKTVMELR
ncbi:glycosyltransferase family 1 protein [Micrococcaceae bacterium Sec5.1]